jgi:hypothetical protein
MDIVVMIYPDRIILMEFGVRPMRGLVVAALGFYVCFSDV